MLPCLGEMFPGASFLHVLRDGQRVVHSMMHYLDHLGTESQKTYRGQHRPPAWYSDFRKACSTWAYYVNAVLDFDASHPSRLLRVEHERLVANPADGFQRIFRFLGVPEEETPINYFLSTRMNSSFPDRSLVKNTSEIWSGWSSEQRDIFMEEADATLKRCGYPSACQVAEQRLALG